MNYILYHDNYSDDSPEWIVEAMSEPCNLVKKIAENEWQEFDQKTLKWKPLPSIMKILRGNNHIINWGNRIFRDDGYFCLNKPSAIGRASNKRTGRQILQSAGVATPLTLFPKANMSELYYQGIQFPVIVRPSHHERGHDFYLKNSPSELLTFLWGKDSDEYYVSEIFPKTHEFRAHVAHGKITMMNIKPFQEGNPLTGDFVNHGTWKALRWNEFHAGMCQEALKATDVLGLDYAAVDILYNAHNNTWVICEVNTSPDVRVEYSSSKYAAYFSWLIRHNFPEHFARQEGTNIFYSEELAG